MPPFKPYPFSPLPPAEQLRRAREMRERFESRRSIRDFADTPVDRVVLEEIVRTASSAPSGANRQPWTFVIVTEPELKHAIRMAAEKEEKAGYEHRMPQEWLDDLAPLGTDWRKPFLEVAPALIVVFAQTYGLEGGTKKKHYYVGESVGIATGFLLAAVHTAGLVALTHTPSPMGFLGKILRRPPNEKAYMLIPVGQPAPGARVPDVGRKQLDQVLIWR